MAKQRPLPEELTELSQQKGMTFQKLANHYQVDRKTIKRWCLDVGITEVGAKQPQKDDFPMNNENAVMVRASSPLDIPEETKEAAPVPGEDLTWYIQEISYKLRNDIPLEEKEAMLYIALMDIIMTTMKPDIDRLHERIDKHYHSLLSVDQGRAYTSERHQARRATS